MSKVKIIDRRSEKSIKSERDFLSRLHHPFIVNMACSFQDYENLYLVMDLLTGGDLRYHLCHSQKFSEEETKFFFACVLLGLEYIHKNNIIHRDIKPENLVCDENGYIRITDFGVAKIMKPENSSETSGTPGYMAPEVLFGQNHSFTADFFALGVMGYEFMFGTRPYIGKNRKEIKKLVIEKEAKIKFDEIQNGWCYESVDFINKCLKRKKKKRLGCNNGILELKNHSWFKGFNWDKLYNKKKIVPFIPKKGYNFDKKYCEAIEKLSEKTLERYQKYKQQENFINIFNEYTFINYDMIPGIFVETNTRVTTKTTNTKTSKDIHNVNDIERKYMKNNNFVKVEINEKRKVLMDKIKNMKELKYHKRMLNLDNIDSHFKLKVGKESHQDNDENIFTKSVYNNINNIFNKIKKLANSTRNKLKNTPYNSLMEISNSNLSNLKNNLSYTKNQNKRNTITKRYTNDNFKSRNISNNGSLSNSNRDKIALKLNKNNSFFANSILNKKRKNNFMNLKLSNYIRLRKMEEEKKMKYDFPYLNKNSKLNIRKFKEKIQLNLNNQNNNYKLNSRNKHFLSPTYTKLKKSQSDFFFKTPINNNSNNKNDLNKNLRMNIEKIENYNLYNTFIQNKFKNYSQKKEHKRK